MTGGHFGRQLEQSGVASTDGSCNVRTRRSMCFAGVTPSASSSVCHGSIVALNLSSRVRLKTQYRNFWAAHISQCRTARHASKALYAACRRRIVAAQPRQSDWCHRGLQRGDRLCSVDPPQSRGTHPGSTFSCTISCLPSGPFATDRGSTAGQPHRQPPCPTPSVASFRRAAADLE